MCAGVLWALSRTTIITLTSFAGSLRHRRASLRPDQLDKELSFLLLQLINSLKYLEAQGVEAVPADLDRFLLARVDGDAHYRLILADDPPSAEDVGTGGGGGRRKLTLCQCALAAMLLVFDAEHPLETAGRAEREPLSLPPILPSVSMYTTMATILQQDGSVALGQVKSMLEYMLWGTSDIIFDLKVGREAESREAALQRWLDLERATVLNSLIRSQGILNVSLTVYQEYHLLFLVRTCAKMLREASLLFESEVSRM